MIESIAFFIITIISPDLFSLSHRHIILKLPTTIPHSTLHSSPNNTHQNGGGGDDDRRGDYLPPMVVDVASVASQMGDTITYLNFISFIIPCAHRSSPCTSIVPMHINRPHAHDQRYVGFRRRLRPLLVVVHHDHHQTKILPSSFLSSLHFTFFASGWLQCCSQSVKQ